jgi:hypothetical protein
VKVVIATRKPGYGYGHVMTYKFDTSKPSHFACSSFDHMVVSTLALSAGVYRCGPGKFAHWGVCFICYYKLLTICYNN